jgi:hypothetical protein
MAPAHRSAEKQPMTRGRPFPKGTSGNPGGRKATDKDLKEYFRRMSWTAARILLDIAETGTQERARVMAASKILEYGIGKPVQPVKGEGDDGAIVVRVMTLTDPSEADG